MTLSYLRKLFNKNSFVYSVLIGLCLLAYANILGNEFTVVDDLATFVNNETIRSFPASLKLFHLQLVIYSAFYHLFGITPVPLHIMSILLHITNAILLFTILKMLFDRRTAFIAAVLFAVHPINTEAVTWISGNPYLFIALNINLTVLNYILYKKTKHKNYLIASISIFIAGMIFIQAIWLVTIPIVIFFIEQFILEKKVNLKASKVLLVYAIPLVVFGTLFIGIKGPDRLATRSITMPMNQQALKSVVEGAPYTVFTMARLYIFPKDLMIYYDGNPVDRTYYISMYAASLLYLVLVLYLWNKNRAVSGILIILIVLLAPAFSPVKVAWYLSERYLYAGSGLFTAILAFLIIYAGKKLRQPIVPLIILLILIGLYSARTIIRNSEYKNSKTLALATIRTSPMSIRGYDDIGGDYLMKGNYKASIPYFKKTLTLLPDSNTATSNLGYIYILYGIPQSSDDLTEKKSPSELLRLGTEYYKLERFTNAFYYSYQSSLLDPSNVKPKLLMGDIYIKMNQYEFAEKMFKRILAEHPEEYRAYNKLAFIAFQQKEYDLAQMYLKEVLKKDPMNQNVLDNLTLIEQIKNTR